MRILAIGDIHGCSQALTMLLHAVAPQPEDLIVTLGDYVDRGPDSYGVIERLIALHKTERLVALKGNHELMMLNARTGRMEKHGWLAGGGAETLTSYSILGDEGKLVDVPDQHWEFLEQKCANWHETAAHFFVHANAHPGVPLAEQSDLYLFWEKFDNYGPHCSGKIMVCGHTQQRNGLPRNLGHAVCIDTAAYKPEGWLTCLDVTSGQIWQANQAGQQRTGRLCDPE